MIGRRGTPAVDWEAIADGRIWRLTRGRHYEGSDSAVIAAAREAAGRMGKVVSIAREDFGPTAGYVWLQFADAEVDAGSPCPRCGSTTLTRSHPGFATCPQCGARLVLAVGAMLPGRMLGEDRPDDAPDDAGDDAGEPRPAPARAARFAPDGEPRAAGSDAAAAAGEAGPAPSPAPAPPRLVGRQLPQIRFERGTRSIERLEFYEQIRLKTGSNPAGISSFYGFGQARGVKPTFLYVEFFPAERSGDLGDHRVTALAARPYAAAVDLRALGDWAQFEIRPLRPADRDELTPVHPYYSLHRATGVHVIPVAADAELESPPRDPNGGSGPT